MTPDFPCLLVATEFPPNASGGGPAIVRQMLRGWPTEKLSWWSCRADTSEKFGRGVAAHFVARIPPKLYPHERFLGAKAWMLDKAWTPYASKHFRKVLETTRPEAIWVIPHQWSIPPLARVLGRADFPYHVSIHDFPDAHHLDRRMGSAVAHRFIALTNELYREARSRDTISEAMSAEFAAVTGAAAEEIVHAGLEPEDFSYLAGKAPKNTETIDIAYAGSVVAEPSLILFVESLERIRSRLPKRVALHFFGAHSYRARPWFRNEWMIEHGDLSAIELNQALRDFDWGFAPMELTDSNPRYNRFSLPTKVVSYLAAGFGVISLAHETATISRLARRYRFGLSITESRLGGMDAILSEGLAKSEVWERYGPEIIRCATAEFDAEVRRRGLWSRLGVR